MKNMKRLVALLIVVVMMVSMLPLSAFASLADSISVEESLDFSEEVSEEPVVSEVPEVSEEISEEEISEEVSEDEGPSLDDLNNIHISEPSIYGTWIGKVETYFVSIEEWLGYVESVTWESSDESIAYITDSGYINTADVHFIAAGEVTITATIVIDGTTITPSRTIYVYDPNIVSSFFFCCLDGVPHVEGGTDYFWVDYSPNSATYESITWEISDESIASINPRGIGCDVYFLSDGEVTITATVYSGGNVVTESKTITIEPAPIYPEEIYIESISDLYVGDCYWFGCDVYPSDAVYDYYYWSSSDESVATITDDGYVECLSEGYVEFTVTVVSAIGTISSSVDYYVSYYETSSEDPSEEPSEPEEPSEEPIPTEEPSEDISEEPSEPEVSEEPEISEEPEVSEDVSIEPVYPESVYLYFMEDCYAGYCDWASFEVYPWDAEFDYLIWESSDESVATVDESGYVECLSEGWFTLSVTVVCGDYTITEYIERYVYSDSASEEPSEEPIPTEEPSEEISEDISEEPSEPEVSEDSEYVGGMFVVGVEWLAVGREGEFSFGFESSPSEMVYESIVWESSDESIATVDENGCVRGISQGEVMITVTVVYNGEAYSEYAYCNIYNAYVEYINIGPVTDENYVGHTFRFDYEVYPSYAVYESVTWESDNEDVATVDENGLVTFVGEGYAEITLTIISNGEVYTSSNGFNVYTPIPVESIEIHGIDSEIPYVDSYDYIYLELYPYDSCFDTVIWESSNEEIAYVDYNGSSHTYSSCDVNFVGAGEVTITVTLVSGENTFTDSVTFNVIDRPALESIEIAEIESFTVYEKSADWLTLSFYPEAASYDSVEWELSDERIAYFSLNEPVDSKAATSGNMNFYNIGEVTLTVTVKDGENVFTDYVTFTIVERPAMEGIAFDDVDLNSAYIGNSDYIAVKAVPDEALLYYDSVVWESSDETIAYIEGYGSSCNVYFESVGEVTITVTVISGEEVYTDSVTYNVTEYPMVESINMAVPEELFVGDSYNFECEIYPWDAGYESITWTSSNEAVATVDQEGYVTALSEGDVTITVTVISCGQEFSSSADYYVQGNYIYDFWFNAIKAYNYVGETFELYIECDPWNGSYESLVWESDNENVATVDQNGLVTFVGEGFVRITATMVSGGNTISNSTCIDVYESVPVESVYIYDIENIYVGDYYSLGYGIEPHYAYCDTVTWESGNEEIAVIDEYSNVSFLSAGEVTITLIIISCGEVFTDSVTVNVMERPAMEAVEIYDIDSETVYIGEYDYLYASFLPEGALPDSVVWEVSNEDVSHIYSGSDWCDIYFDALGEVTLTVIATFGENTFTDSVTFNVIERPALESVEITEVNTETPCVGDYDSIYLNLLPEVALYDSVIWESSNEEIAYIDYGSDWCDVYFATAGEVTITVTVVSGENNFTDSVTYVVSQRPYVESVNIYDIGIASPYAGDYNSIWAEVLPEDYAYDSVTWTSSNEEIAYINYNNSYYYCDVYFQSAGEVTITLTVAIGDEVLTDSVTYNVGERPAAERIEISEKYNTYYVGDCSWFDCWIYPEGAYEEITWSSSDESVAVITEGNRIEFVGVGTVTITATSESGLTDTATFEITERPALEGVEITEVNTETPYVGDYDYVHLNFLPEGAYEEITWSSSDESVAVITEGNRIEFVGVGTVTITATSESGLTDTATFEITERPALERIEVGVYSGTYYVDPNHLYGFGCQFYPENAYEETTWSSSDESVAIVDGNNIIFVGVGTVTITATSESGLTDSFTCNVIERPALESIEVYVGYMEGDGYYVGDYGDLGVHVNPEGADYDSVVWESGDESIATIDSNGSINYLSVGEVTFTATVTVDGQVFVDSITLTVAERPELIDASLDASYDHYNADTYYQFNLNLNPYNGGYDSIEWEVSDRTIAEIAYYEYGCAEIYFYRDGVVTITVTITVGERVITDSVTVTVGEEPPTEEEDDVIVDVDNNGSLGASDYFALKALVFETAEFSNFGEEEEVFQRCDINDDGKVNGIDYFLLKRAIFKGQN